MLRTTLEIAGLILVLVATFAGCYWLLRKAGITSQGAALLLFPAALLMVLTSIYAYYMGWENRRGGFGRVPPGLVFKNVLLVFLFALLVLVSSVFTMYFLVRAQPTLGLTLMATATVVGLLGLRRIHRKGVWLSGEVTAGAGAEASSWPTFERRFRIIVFSLVVGLPLGLALIFVIVFRNLAVSALLAVMAAGIAPWALRKIGSERRRRER